MKPAPLLFVALSLAWTATAAPARAQKPPAILEQDRAVSDHADELFRAGNVLAKQDRWTEAEPLFREAWGLKRSYDIAGNLGIAEASLRRWRDAAEHLSFAMRTFPANGKPEHRKLLEGTLARALHEVATLRIEVAPEKADVLVDGKSVGTAPLADAVFLEPGTRTVRARLAGYETAAATVEAAKGAAIEVRLEMKKEVVVPPVPPPAPEPRRPAWPAVVSGVLAAGGLAAGAALTVAANGKSSDLARLQNGQSSTCFAPGAGLLSQCSALHDAAVNKTTLSNAAASAFLVGGVFAAATAGLSIWAVTSPVVVVRAVPTVGAGQAGVTLQGAW
jgi:tetratricopeptide (TPR) repeat protein